MIVLRLLLVSGLLAATLAVANVSDSAASKAVAGNPRVALVIGNAAYTDAPALDNTINDASDVCSALRELKFETLCFMDVKTRRDFKRHVADFKAKLGPGIAGLFYYAGHGMQIDGENYLVPTAAQIQRKEDVEDESLSMRFVMSALDEAQNDFNLIILDACRNSPFSRGFSRAIGRGLAPVSETPVGSLVLYATAANETASDGPSNQRNSPFTKHLLANIKQPGLPVEGLIKRITAGVQGDTLKRTGKRQVPFTYGSFTGEFCFAGCANPADQAAQEALKQQQAALEKKRAELAEREMALNNKQREEVASKREMEKTSTRSAAQVVADQKPPPKMIVPPSF